FNKNMYKVVREDNTEGIPLLRRLQFLESWYKPEEVQRTFNDLNTSIQIIYTLKGIARPGANQLWEILLGNFLPKEIKIQKNSASFSTWIQYAVGITSRFYTLSFPSSVSQIQILPNPTRIAFQMTLPTNGNQVNNQLEWETQPFIMSCIAKSYGYKKFENLWIACVRFRNTGNQILKEYRIRFRVAKYSPNWSPWESCSIVVPGQTVVDPYFPLLDIEEIGKVEGRRQSVIEVEYEYKQADGTLKTKTEARNIEILGKNEVTYSSILREDQKDFYDRFNLCSYILASFVTKDDPVIQQVAGRVSGKIAISASSTDEEAILFMGNLYEFMQTCNIAYQTPPEGDVEGRFFQHVKYGRDVLQNRAGTCIDLAIFFASVCEAVGLDPVLYLIPGHCFPAVILPKSGNVLAVEATVIVNCDFLKAAQIGKANLDKINNGLSAYYVQISKARESGIHSMELKPLPENVLELWGYSLKKAQSLLGFWIAQVTVNNVLYRIDSEFKGNGTMTAVWKDPQGQIVFQGGGNYTYNNGYYTIDASGGFHEEAEIRWLDQNHFVYKVLKSTNAPAIGSETLNTRR
ncbi:MAG: hypothetical protein AABZ60_05765, partial [Planctomycetota bacterium]